ncbi:MAG: OB-fold nucleic acid binding domain-containing protein, partial [Candidatus Nealsonbacteria bacterium]|nr:OB-fold nucleic acid binding domain-containing protein [Candidatus Nealsonbacteria bacterium]
GGAGKPTLAKSTVQLEKAREASKAEKLIWEKELLGLFVTSHPLEEYRTAMEKKCMEIARVKTSQANRLVKIGGVITTIKKILTKSGKQMIFMGLEDLTDKIEIVVFNSVLEKNALALQVNKVVFVYGRVDSRDGEIKIVADNVEEIIEVSAQFSRDVL